MIINLFELITYTESMTLKLQQMFPNIIFNILFKNHKERIISFSIDSKTILLARSTISKNAIFFSNLIQNTQIPIGKELFSKANNIKRKTPLLISILNNQDIKNTVIFRNIIKNNYTKPIIKRESLFFYNKEKLKIEEYLLI